MSGKPQKITLVIVVLAVILILSACTLPAFDTPASIGGLSSENNDQDNSGQSGDAQPSLTFTTEPTWTWTPEPTATFTPTSTATPSWVGPESFGDGINPLTGEMVSDPTLLNRIPLALKVSNFPAAGRPHFGLSFADLVFEYYIGEGMTRFLVFFYGQDAEKVGPIRSGRLIDGQLVRMYGGVLGMKGADIGTTANLNQKLPGRVFNAVPAACPALCPYTISHTYGTFSDTAAFSEYIETRGLVNSRPELEGMRFDSNPPEGGQQAEFLHIYYNWNDQVGWEYDAERGVYLRSQDPADGTGELYPMPDALTGEQLAFENVVVLYALHTFHNPTTIEIEMWYANGRRALFLRDGVMVEGTFSAVDEDHPLRFETVDGESYSFKPGSTWFQIVGLGSMLNAQEEPGSWYLQFIP
ncbi:MAG: DUF3048 domain-containing protein [Anaerolineales bacterium]|nr:DUF3048 domain-containing protein [Anaerolineales bacterium]